MPAAAPLPIAPDDWPSCAAGHALANCHPSRLGITHWSTRLLGRELGVSRDTVAGIWREYGVRPWRTETFKFSTDPQLEAKVHDVQLVRRIWLDRPEQRTHDYIRHGTTTLFAALEVATGASSTSAPRAIATRSSWGSSRPRRSSPSWTANPTQATQGTTSSRVATAAV